jgi:CRISPR-associated protein Cmr5
MNVPSLEQQRAASALKAIEELSAAGGYGKYVSYVKGLPAAILQNGLGQAMATLLAGAALSKPDRSADHKARETLYQNLSYWLCCDKGQAPYRNAADLMKAITENDEDHYIRAQAEALAYLSWLKKFAVAYLRDE